MRRIALAGSVVAVVIASAMLAIAPAVWACGSLVAPNGAVQLVRTTTLAAHHDGVEHYVTNFEFASNQPSFGSIIPLPGKPTTVERGGAWTLQRLEREVTPRERVRASVDAAPARQGVDVITRTRIDSLDVTIVRGGGKGVASWAARQGFTLTEDTPEVLEFYSRRSPYFMAAKFDASSAVARGLDSGDGVPVHLTIPVDHPWVPLRILATGKPADEVVRADVFLLTDRKPALLAGRGVDVERSQRASTSLLGDLRADKGMGWLPAHGMWLSFLKVNVRAGDLDYDLATDVSSRHEPSAVDAGFALPGAVPTGGSRSAVWAGALLVSLLAAVLGLTATRRARVD